MTADIATKVSEIIARHALASEKSVPLSSTIADLGIESLGLAEIIFEIEDCFGISVPFNMNDPTMLGFDVSTVASIIASVEGLIARQAA